MFDDLDENRARSRSTIVMGVKRIGIAREETIERTDGSKLAHAQGDHFFSIGRQYSERFRVAREDNRFQSIKRSKGQGGFRDMTVAAI
jgi:hypothetical protein